MPKYQAEFHREQAGYRRFVTFDVTHEEAIERKAYEALFSLPHIKGAYSDWKLQELFLCDDPIPRQPTMAEYVRLVAVRITDNVVSGVYRPGQQMPTRSVWAVRLGVKSVGALDSAIEVVRRAGFVDTNKCGTHIQPEEFWQIDKRPT